MKQYLFLVLLIASQASYSNDFRLGIGIGRSDVDLPEIAEDPNNSAGKDSFSTSLHIGYKFPKKIVIDIGINVINDVSLFGTFDALDYKAQEILVGYLFVKDKLYFEPKIGYARWHTTVDQGAIFNSGPELRVKEKGTDPFFVLTAGYRFTEIFGMSLSYKHLDFDDIKAKSYILGFDLAF